MNKDIKSIAIVGGGTAGFVSALILKKTYPDLRIDIIRSTKIGTIGVGEGSTEHWSVFMDYVGIQTAELINECDSTFKTGIMFEDWATKPYLQSVHSPFVADTLGIPIAYAKLIGEKRPASFAHNALKDAIITPKDKIPESTKEKIKIFTEKYW